VERNLIKLEMNGVAVLLIAAGHLATKANSKIDTRLTAGQKQKHEQLPQLSFVPSVPLLSPGEFFTSSASRGTELTPWKTIARPHSAPAKDHTARVPSVCSNGKHISSSLRREEKQC
jgi:hypothetical protein